jgi:hypothetical protein
MKTSEYIAFTIDRFPKGYVFTYADFITKVNKKEAIIKTLNRMAASGKIVKLAKGKFYKSETTTFGNLQPKLYQIVKDLLEDKGRITGYLTGYSIYNQLGLTTQVSSIIQIGKNEIRPSLNRERYTISFIKQKNTITKENIPLLQLLDAIRYIKKIPDTINGVAVTRLLAIISGMKENEIRTLARLAIKYPPATRALTGALLQEVGETNITEVLRKSLNPISTYKLSGITSNISSTSNWNIIE